MNYKKYDDTVQSWIQIIEENNHKDAELMVAVSDAFQAMDTVGLDEYHIACVDNVL